MKLNEKYPSWLVGASRTRSVSWFLAVLLTLGITAPVESVTRPARVPETVCADAAAQRAVIPARILCSIAVAYQKQSPDNCVSVRAASGGPQESCPSLSCLLSQAVFAMQMSLADRYEKSTHSRRMVPTSRSKQACTVRKLGNWSILASSEEGGMRE